MHSGPEGESDPCVHRESPIGRVIIVIVAEREERDDKRGKREREKREEKRRERRTDRKKRERARKTEKAENPSVCRLKTPPCVRSRRLRMYGEKARMSNTCGRFPGTHGGVLNAHTEAF